MVDSVKCRRNVKCVLQDLLFTVVLRSIIILSKAVMAEWQVGMLTDEVPSFSTCDLTQDSINLPRDLQNSFKISNRPVVGWILGVQSFQKWSHMSELEAARVHIGWKWFV